MVKINSFQTPIYTGGAESPVERISPDTITFALHKANGIGVS
jgi:hypothetical protein